MRGWKKLTENSSWGVITGETGLAHAGAGGEVSMIVVIEKRGEKMK